jgi:hypothetical protein
MAAISFFHASCDYACGERRSRPLRQADALFVVIQQRRIQEKKQMRMWREQRRVSRVTLFRRAKKNAFA